VRDWDRMAANTLARDTAGSVGGVEEKRTAWQGRASRSRPARASLNLPCTGANWATGSEERPCLAEALRQQTQAASSSRRGFSPLAVAFGLPPGHPVSLGCHAVDVSLGPAIDGLLGDTAGPLVSLELSFGHAPFPLVLAGPNIPLDLGRGQGRRGRWAGCVHVED
jgi:hypothetical protein